MGLYLHKGYDHAGYMCGVCWDECKQREDSVRENMKERGME